MSKARRSDALTYIRIGLATLGSWVRSWVSGIGYEAGDYMVASDPYVLRLEEGGYLYVRSGGGSRPGRETQILIGRISSLDDFANVEMHVAIDAGKLPPEASRQLWAPEVYRFYETDGPRYYIYFAGSDGRNPTHRMYVARSCTDDPTGEYELVGKIAMPGDPWAIDGTILNHNDKRYFIWSGWERGTHFRQVLNIAEMVSPTELVGTPTRISVPTYEWERRVMDVNEGPAVLYGDKIFVSYSGSASWTDEYCIGLLELVGDDPMETDSWRKHEQPLLDSDQYNIAPGHNSFTRDDEGDDVIVYHTAHHPGSGWKRVVRTAKIDWKNGLPVVRKFEDVNITGSDHLMKREKR